MTLSAFTDKNHTPAVDELRATLGRAFKSWETLLELVANRIGPTVSWGFTSASTGWGLRVRQKERVILYMAPQAGQFLVSFALGEKAAAAAQASRLPESIKAAIAAAPRYAEGRGVRFEVRNSRPLVALATLAVIKCQN